MKRHSLLAIATMTLLINGCGKKEPEAQMDVADDVAPMAEPGQPTVYQRPEQPQEQIDQAAQPAQQEAAAPKDNKVVIGVEACDTFLDRYRRCFDELPPGIQREMEAGLRDTETALLQASQNPDDAARLEEACYHLNDAVSQPMIEQGCNW